MRSFGTERKHPLRSWLVLLLAAALLCPVLCPAAAEGALSPDDPDMILAQDTVSRLGLKAADGSPMTVRSDPSVPGRGAAAADYTGLIGFAAMAEEPGTSMFSVFDKAYWTIPLFRKTEEGYVQDGVIAHRTPVVAVSRETGADGAEYLEVIRLDTAEPCLLEAVHFVTLAYWDLPVRRIPAYGYCIAVYRETPGEGPRFEDGKPCAMRDGTRVLIPSESAAVPAGPDAERLPVAGIIFREEGNGNIIQTNVYFRETDLVVIY